METLQPVLVLKENRWVEAERWASLTGRCGRQEAAALCSHLSPPLCRGWASGRVVLHTQPDPAPRNLQPAREVHLQTLSCSDDDLQLRKKAGLQERNDNAVNLALSWRKAPAGPHHTSGYEAGRRMNPVKTAAASDPGPREQLLPAPDQSDHVHPQLVWRSFSHLMD